MNRKLKLPLFALCLFVAGTIAGRFILIDRESSQNFVEHDSTTMARRGGPFRNTLTKSSLPGHSPFQDVSFDGFESQPSISLISSNEIVESDSSVDDAEATRSIIRQRFPDLAGEVLNGWVDAYRDLPLQELEQLLSEKQMMAELMPVSSFLQPLDQPVPPPETAHGIFSESIRAINRNLLHATTPGFRRSIVRTSLAGAPGASSNAVRVNTVFDFRPGKFVSSICPTHFAIDDDGSHWFRFASSDLLTRCGVFVRLDTGQLGIIIGDTTLRLATDVRLPEIATELQVSNDGTVTYVAESGSRMPAGTLQLAKVSDLTKIRSVDGVFFVADDHSAIAMASGVPVRTGTLEEANVDLATERKWLNHFEQLEAFE